jgi:hypothetical protein
MQEMKTVRSEKAALDDKASGNRSWLRRLFSWRTVLRGGAVLLALVLAVLAWWYFPRAITLRTQLEESESLAVGSAVVLDDDVVGKISDVQGHGASRIAEIKLRGLSSGQKKKLKDGLVRVSGLRMVWLTSEFIDRDGPPLIDGDIVPVISRVERDHRKMLASFYSWIVPGSGVGLLWLLWRGAKRLMT